MMKNRNIRALDANIEKFCRIMRITTLFLIIVMSISAKPETYSQSTFFTLELNNRTVKEVFNEIEKKSNFIFFYYDNAVDVNRKVNVNSKNQTVDKILNKVFAGTDNTYVINDRQIFISKKSDLPRNPSTTQQRSLIKGKVLDENDEPLPGAAILVVGSTRGVTTDIDGSFEIEVGATEKLTISYLGMQDQIITVGNQRTLVVKLKAKADELDEVTVVAFGKQKKESVIGAITSVTVSDLKVPVGKISTSLAGQMAGIVAVQRSGEPGSGADFWIRGVNTFGANNRPLVLVDGIERPLDLVDTEDIETFSILKDATATAVYGVRGANGVVLVTTRKGKEGKPVISGRVEYGVMSPTKMPKMTDALEFMKLYNDVYKEDNNGNVFYTEEEMNKYLTGVDPDLYPNVNWMDEIYKDMTTSQRVNINISGGGKNVRYYVAGSIYNENGVFNAEKGDEYNPSLKWTKYNFRSNIDIDLSKSTMLNLNLSTQYDVKNKPDTDDLWIYSFQTVPIAIPKEYSDGTTARTPIGVNPYNLLNKTGYVQQFNNNAQSLIGLTQDFSDLITPGLKANVKFSWDAVNSTTTSRYKSPSTYYATGRDEEGKLIFKKNNDGNDYLSLWSGSSGERTTYLEASVNYENIFDEKHRVGGLFLFNMRERINNFPGSYVLSLPYRHQGIAARATYSFMDKYFVEGNFGYNGSENFAPGKRFGFFPSVALGYMISNEQFFTPLLPVISSLKFKGSYGTIGNDQIGGDRRFAFNPEMLVGGGYGFGEVGQTWLTGIATGYPGSPNVSWEKAIKMNVGVEMELFHSLKIQADYFEEKREGIFILRESVPSVVGINVNPYVNLGRMKNSGIDLSLEYNKQIGDFNVSGRGNFTFNRNKKLYDDAPTPIYDYQSVIGKPLYQQFGLICLGYFESEDDIANSPVQQYGVVRPGDRKYKDVNGDGVVNSYDKVAIGRTHVPEINYGYGVSIGWKGFDASIFMQGVANVTNFMDGSPINGFENANLFLSGVYEDVALNRWTVENPNPNAKYPRMSSYINQNNKQLSTAKQYDASFMRLKNAELGYTIPKNITQRLGVSTFRFYLQGVNLLTFSKFKLWDPELNNSMGAAYPNMRVVNLGINLNF